MRCACSRFPVKSSLSRLHLLPAVKENAAETCASKCKIGGSDDPLLQLEDPVSVKNKQEYDACYSKCVAQETKEVAEEREKVRSNDEQTCLEYCCVC